MIYEINYDNLQLVLDEYGKEFTEYLKTLIEKKDKVASKKLLSSIKCQTQPNSNHSVYKVVLFHKDYLKYVENGTRPHWAPIKPLIQWVHDKGIPTGDGRKGNLPTEKQVAYAVQYKIAKKGTKGTPLVEETQSAVYPKYPAKIAAAFEKDVYDTIREAQIHISIHVS